MSPENLTEAARSAESLRAELHQLSAELAVTPDTIPLPGAHVERRRSSVLGIASDVWYVVGSDGQPFGPGYPTRARADRAAQSARAHNPARTEIMDRVMTLLTEMAP